MTLNYCLHHYARDDAKLPAPKRCLQRREAMVKDSESYVLEELQFTDIYKQETQTCNNYFRLSNRDAFGDC